MIALIQRCNNALVKNNYINNHINKGIVVFLSINKLDTIKDIDYIIKKIINIRIFNDNNNKMNYSIKDINGEVMIVSEFTLYGNINNGNRPSFTNSMNVKDARNLYNIFINKFKDENIKFVTGEFQTDMIVNIENDGPVTFIIDSKNKLS